MEVFLYKACTENIAFEFFHEQISCIYSNFDKMQTSQVLHLKGFFFSCADALFVFKAHLKIPSWTDAMCLHQVDISIKENVVLKRFIFFMNYGNVYVQGFVSFMNWCNMCMNLNLSCKDSITSDTFLLSMNWWKVSF